MAATISPSSLSNKREPYTSASARAYTKFTVTSITQSDGGKNTTTINWQVTVHSNGEWVGLYKFKCTLGGKVLYDSDCHFEGWKQGQVFISGSTEFQNNQDGSLSLDVYMKQQFWYGTGDPNRWNNPYFYQEASTTMICSTIPRAMVPSCNNTTLGTAVTIDTNRVSNDFTHKIEIIKNKTVIETIQAPNKTVTWTPSLAKYAPLITNSREGVFSLKSTCYKGSEVIGSHEISVTLYVPEAQVKPSASLTIQEANPEMQRLKWGVYLVNKSQLRLLISASASYGATISKYLSTVEGITRQGSDVTTSILHNAGKQSVSYEVTDSRGTTSAKKTLSYTVEDYSNPYIIGSAARCTSSGELNDEGTYLKYSVTGRISPVANHNAKSFRIGYKPKANTYYTYITLPSSSYNLNISNQILSGVTFSTDVSYDIVFEASDSFETNKGYAVLGTGFDIININASGNAMAIGKISEATGNQRLFEVGMESVFNKKTDFKGGIYSNGSKITPKDPTYQLLNVDDRSLNHSPSYYFEKFKQSIVSEFKSSSSVGVPLKNTYCNLLTINPWTDSSGGYPIQLAINDEDRIMIRSGTGQSSWSEWNEFATLQKMNASITQLNNKITALETKLREQSEGTVIWEATGFDDGKTYGGLIWADFKPYRYLDVSIIANGIDRLETNTEYNPALGNGTNNVIRIDLTKRSKYPIVRRHDMNFYYGGALMYPDIQTLVRWPNDPGFFYVGVAVGDAKNVMVILDESYCLIKGGNSGSIEINGSDIYQRVVKVIGYK